MGRQVIQQPDGRLAVFSNNVDSWVLMDATPDEVVEEFATEAADQARKHAQRVVDAILEGQPRRIYAQFAMTFDEAEQCSKETTGQTFEELRALAERLELSAER